MPLTVLIAPDKFKGTLTAADAAASIARGWIAVRRQDRVQLLPMSDGGDGFGDVLSRLLSAQPERARTVNAAGKPCRAPWWWAPKTRTAIIESAQIIGLAMHPGTHPFDLDTFGLGTIIRAAGARRARRYFIGIGGSATNDGGFGLARALGWTFRDRRGRAIERWTHLFSLDRIEPPRPRRRLPHMIVAVDVQNPLLGARGATRVYGPQKGLRASELATAERCLRRLAGVFEQQFGGGIAMLPGAGAAGGLGFGLMAFGGAQARPGFDVFARSAGLRRLLRRADLVITGEGRMDRSTLMGKGAGEIARMCRRYHVPCISLCGAIDGPGQFKIAFTRTRALTGLTTEAQARAKPRLWLERLARETAGEWTQAPVT